MTTPFSAGGEGNVFGHERSSGAAFPAGRGASTAAALVAALLVAGCGTRLNDAEFRAAAELGESAAAPLVPPDGNGGSTEGVAEAPVSAAEPIPETGEASGIASSGIAASRRPATQAAAGPGTAGNGSRPPSAPVAAGQSRPAPATAASGPSADPSGPPTDAAAGGAAAPAPAPRALAKSPVRLGHIGDYSGIVGSVLGAGALAAQVTVRYINDHGGLNGHPVQLITGDSAADPARALSLAKQMVENDGVLGFMGNIWPLSGRGAQSYLEGRRIPVMGGDAAARFWNDSPVYFPHGAAWPTVTLAAAKMAVDLGKPKIAVLHCVEAEACHIWTEVLNARAGEVGAKVVYDAQVSLAQPDFTAECIQARRNGAEAILAGVESASISRLARACGQQGYHPQYVTGSFALVASTAKDPNLDGLVAPVSTFPYPAADTPQTREYHAAIERYAPNIEQSPTTSAVWSAGAMLHHVGRALPDTPTPQDFFEAVWQVKNETFGGLTPPVSFFTNKPTPETNCYFTMAAQRGTFVAPQGSRHSCF